ncbi:DUF1192 family protein [Roseococcus sp. DSY-14]|uniref:DUF1192 family protein n=1 Tax=Roseococcus sp. DSY-14 TaxID=3369650 RepID=UPI00387B7549
MDMFEEEPRPRPKDGFQPAKLEGWSAEALRAYLEDLATEMRRAEAALAAKDHQKAAAEAFFRKS